MPLAKGCSKRSRRRNVRLLIDEGRAPRQAVAIAYAQQRRAGCLYTYRIFHQGRLIDVLRTSEKYPLALVEVIESEARGFPVTAKRG